MPEFHRACLKSHISHLVKAHYPDFEGSCVGHVYIRDIEMDAGRKCLSLTVGSAGFYEASLDTEGRVHEFTIRAL